MNRKILALTVILLTMTTISVAQDHTSFYTGSLNINRSGMYLLGGWAIANLVTGTWGTITHTGHQKYFHQMNAAWNIVNAGIAAYALYDISTTNPALLSQAEVMKQQIRTENIFLFNAGLDILYIAGGAWMIRAASNNAKRHDLLKGYGQSVILQGAFLFVFDLSKYAIQRNHRLDFTQTALDLGLSSDGLSLILRF